MAWAKTDVDPIWWSRRDSDDPEVTRNARAVIVEHYLGLVDGVVYRKHSSLPSWVEVDDLRSMAYIGLLQAIDRYDPSLGSFRKFASSRISGSIGDELRSQDAAPRGLRKVEREITEAVESIRGDEDKPPSIAHVAEHMGWEEARLESTLRRLHNLHSHPIDYAESLPNRDDDPEGDLTADKIQTLFVRYYDQFPIEAQVILARRYFLGETMTEVAERLNAPLTHVRDLHRAVIVWIFCQVYEVVGS